jgi:hypothetical protein
LKNWPDNFLQIILQGGQVMALFALLSPLSRRRKQGQITLLDKLRPEAEINRAIIAHLVHASSINGEPRGLGGGIFAK